MNLTVGSKFHGFSVERVTEVPEQSCRLYEMTHEQSGARLIYMDRDDDNKVFGIGFKTIPVDSTGVFHILEHCMLNGSEKYPLKEPFVNLLKNSLNTFLNAMTFPDKTIYPVASQNEKDFFHLMQVYLDAVFAPNLRTNREVFMQEGWHYELFEKDAPLTIKGVVYNEMKGALSSVEGVREESVMDALFPDTCYHHNSGGDPVHIPELTYEQFTASYQKYYHADNSIIFLYGNMDLEEKLAYIDSEYLSKYTKNDSEVTVGMQAPVVNEDYSCEYEIGESDSEQDNTYMDLAYVVGTFADREDLLAFEVLNSALMSTNESPLKKQLMAAGLGQDVKGLLQDGVLQPVYVVSLNKTNVDCKEKFEQTFRSAVETLVKEGIDRETLLAAINNAEFKLREMESGQMPKGIFYYINLLGTMLYGGTPEINLGYESAFAHMKEGVDKGYFEALLQRYLLDSKHHATIVIHPSKTLAKQREEEAAAKAAAYKATLSDEQLEALISENKTLLAHQSQQDTPEQIACLPSLTTDDLQDAPAPTPTEEVEGGKILYHALNTNGIAYLNFYFDLGNVPFEDISYAAMLAEVLGKLGTKHTTAERLGIQTKLNLGDLRFSTTVTAKDADSCRPYLVASCSVLEDNVAKAVALVKEVLTETVFTEQEVARILMQKAAMAKMMVQQAGHQAAILKLGSYLSVGGAYQEQLTGISCCRKLNEVAAAFDGAAVLAKLEGILHTVVGEANLTASVTGSRATLDSFVALFRALELPAGTVAKACTHSLEPKKEGVVIPAGINYVVKGCNYLKDGFVSTGKMETLQQILTYDYLWNEVRVKGGAYGTRCQSAKNTGAIVFWSYRDPNVANTLSAYDGAEEYLKNFEADEKTMTGYIVGTLSGFDQPMSPRMAGMRADEEYASGYTAEKKTERRKEILATTAADIRSYAELIAAMKKTDTIAVVGNKAKIEESGKFEEIKDL